MKKYLPPIFIVIAIAAGIGFYFSHRGSTPVAQRQLLAAQIYTGKKSSFTIQPPAGWTIDDTGASGTLVLFINPTPDHEGDLPLPASINVLSEPLQGLSQEEYILASKQNLQKYSPDYVFTKDSTMKLQGYDAHVFEAHFTSKGKQIYNRQLLVFVGDTVYIITGTSLASAWELHRQVISDSLETFVIVAK